MIITETLDNSLMRSYLLRGWLWAGTVRFSWKRNVPTTNSLKGSQLLQVDRVHGGASELVTSVALMLVMAKLQNCRRLGALGTLLFAQEPRRCVLDSQHSLQKSLMNVSSQKTLADSSLLRNYFVRWVGIPENLSLRGAGEIHIDYVTELNSFMGT